MGWRFRKSLPGVRLNLTGRGLSATFGVAPFSVNVGPKGVYGNISIPGTGIWTRQRIGAPSSPPAGTEEQSQGAGVPYLPPSVLGTTMSPSPKTEIHSASTERLISDSLEQLQRLLTDAYNERNDLRWEASRARAESNDAVRRYNEWNEGFLYSWFMHAVEASRLTV